MEITADFKYLIEEKHFTAEQIFKRAFTWVDIIDSVIQKELLKGSARIDYERLMFMVLCYFSDIARLKKFHDIDTTHVVKIFTYSFYWFLRTAPVQIIRDLSKKQSDWLFINEEIVLGVWECKFVRPLEIGEQLKERYMEEVRYFLKYRHYTAQTIEAMLNALCVGAGKNPFAEEPTAQQYF